MKKYLFPFIIFTLSLSISTAQYQFQVEKTLPCTSIKDQQRTGTCWSFATYSFLESEIQRTSNKSLDLSEMYAVRAIYLDKARNYLLRQGKANFSQGSLSHDVARAIEMAGAIPESIYDGKLSAEDVHDHTEMEKIMKSTLDTYLKSQSLSDKWDEVINGILDVYMGKVPSSFKVEGSTYTPRTFADYLNLKLDNYISVTSFSHHPFYKKFVLEIPDNYSNGNYYNVPLEELTEIVDQAITKGYTVAWDGDVSEKGFSAINGIAVLPKEPTRETLFSEPGEEIHVTQQNRQINFENLSTTDDHLMHLVGTAKDQYGTKYYIIKNSWGEISEYQGYLYMSEAYFKMKTIAVMINRDVLPTSIAQKIAP
jgi:bleomycin hydrolase